MCSIRWLRMSFSSPKSKLFISTLKIKIFVMFTVKIWTHNLNPFFRIILFKIKSVEVKQNFSGHVLFGIVFLYKPFQHKSTVTIFLWIKLYLKYCIAYWLFLVYLKCFWSSGSHYSEWQSWKTLAGSTPFFM